VSIHHIRSFEILSYVFEPSVASKHDISLVFNEIENALHIHKNSIFFLLVEEKSSLFTILSNKFKVLKCVAERRK